MKKKRRSKYGGLNALVKAMPLPEDVKNLSLKLRKGETEKVNTLKLVQ